MSYFFRKHTLLETDFEKNAAANLVASLPGVNGDDSKIKPPFLSEIIAKPADAWKGEGTFWDAARGVIPVPVSLNGLTATQPACVRQKVLDCIREDWMDEIPADKTPIVLQDGSKMYLLDGHHRSSAAQYLGKLTILARIIRV